MSHYRRQSDALNHAAVLISNLPLGTRFALSCTDEDTRGSPTALNVYVDEEDWPKVAKALNLGKVDLTYGHSDEYKFVTYFIGILSLSFIQEVDPDE